MSTEHASDALAPAVLAALDLFRSPDRVALSQASPLPEGVVFLLRVAGGDQGLTDALASEHGLSPEQLVEASAFFVQSVLFHQDSDHFRVLGVSRDADEATLKLHYRWLQKWLHPDRDPDGWSSVYSHRVNMAWDVLKRAERRVEYLESLSPEHRLSTPGKAMAVSPVIIPLERTPRIRWSAKWLGRLPTVVAVLTVLLAIGLWSAHRAGQHMLAEEQRKPVPALAASSMPAAEIPSGVPAAADRADGFPSAAEPVPIPAEPSVAPASAQAPVVAADPPSSEAITPEPAATVAAAPALAVSAAPQVQRPRPDASAEAPDTARERDVALAMPAPAPALPPRPADSAPTSTGAAESVRPAQVPAAPQPASLASTASEVSRRAAAPPSAPAAAPMVAKPKMPVVSVETPPRSAPAAPAIEAPPISPAPVVAAAIETEAEAAVAEVAPPAPPIPAGPSPAQVEQGVQLMRSFSRAYRNGALQELVILFRPNARTPAGNLLDLHGRYQSQFAQSTTRSLEFLNVDWRETEGGLEGVGRYEWALRPRGGGRVRSTGGEFRIVIEFENGRALIAHLEQQDVG